MKKTAKPTKKVSSKAADKKAPAKKVTITKKAAPAKKAATSKTNEKASAKPAKKVVAPVKSSAKKIEPKAKTNAKTVKVEVTKAPKSIEKTKIESKKNIKEKEIKTSIPKPNIAPSAKKGKKAKPNDGEEGFEEVDLEQLLKDAVPVVKKKAKIPQKQKPVEIDEYEEFKRPSFNAKSLTQAIAGPPATPPKAEPVSKVKGKFLKFELEYLVRSSVRLLYEFISTPSGLSEWFADDVNFRNDIYSFIWDKAEQKAKLVKAIENKVVRFQWIEENKDIYFEFRIEVDDLTGDVALIIADFAEDDLSKDAAVLLWNSQVESLLKAIGSY